MATGLWAVWLGMALSQPMTMHACAMHGDTARQMRAPAAHMAGMQGMGGTAAGNDAVHLGAPAQASDPACSCLGDCGCPPPPPAQFAQPFANGPPSTL